MCAIAKFWVGVRTDSAVLMKDGWASVAGAVLSLGTLIGGIVYLVSLGERETNRLSLSCLCVSDYVSLLSLSPGPDLTCSILLPQRNPSMHWIDGAVAVIIGFLLLCYGIWGLLEHNWCSGGFWRQPPGNGTPETRL